MSFFAKPFSTSVQLKCCHGNMVDIVSIKAAANNGP